MDMNDPCLQVDGPCTVRLHVGGLGPSVISSDLVQIFSSLAEVSCVNLVHTKGRNFAYVTIQAASRDIKRLFSLYNGCMWKGGRLKLEKAREFYLDKLRREWADRDCLQAIQTPKLDCSTTARSLVKSKDSTGFNIYIPRLRKVKTIPDKGLGKHKRSFERVDPLPYSLLQVCNCDQHCTTTSKFQTRTRKEPWDVAKEEGLQDSKYVAIKTSTNETSIECEKIVKAPVHEDRKRFEKPSFFWKNGDGQGKNGVPALAEPALNIGGGSHSGKGDIGPMSDIDKAVSNVTECNFTSGKTKESIEGEVLAVANEQTQACVKETQEVGEGLQRKRAKDTWTSNEKKHPGEKRKFMDLRLEEGETNENKACETSSSRSWVQKASWKSLVGETGRMSFSLGRMLEQNLVGNQESPKKERANFETHASILVQDGRERIAQTSDGSRPCSSNGKDEKLRPSSGHDRGFTFVKSSASERDWLESKQVVQRIVKRSHKDALKTLSRLHIKQKH